MKYAIYCWSEMSCAALLTINYTVISITVWKQLSSLHVIHSDIFLYRVIMTEISFHVCSLMNSFL